MVLDGSYNLTEATYKIGLQNLVDRVLITDKDGNQIGVGGGIIAAQKVWRGADGLQAGGRQVTRTDRGQGLPQTLDQNRLAASPVVQETAGRSAVTLIVQETTTGYLVSSILRATPHLHGRQTRDKPLTLAFLNHDGREGRLKPIPRDRRPERYVGRWAVEMAEASARF